MPEDERNGLSLPGSRRLERVEQNQDRLMEMVGTLGNQVNRLIDRQDALIRRADAHDVRHDRDVIGHQAHVDDHEKRHRALDFRVYGVLAALGAAAAYVIYRGGPPVI